MSILWLVDACACVVVKDQVDVRLGHHDALREAIRFVSCIQVLHGLGEALCRDCFEGLQIDLLDGASVSV